jgi:diacylglycerol kinase (ATP)
LAFVLLCLISFLLDVTAVEQVAMIISMLLLRIVEILNSATECVVDRMSTERHTLSGRAKDFVSLTVFIAIIIAMLTWAVILRS